MLAVSLIVSVVLVLVLHLYRDELALSHFTGHILRRFAVGLRRLRAVDALDADSHALPVGAFSYDRVPVLDPADVEARVSGIKASGQVFRE